MTSVSWIACGGRRLGVLACSRSATLWCPHTDALLCLAHAQSPTHRECATAHRPVHEAPTALIERATVVTQMRDR